MYRKGYGRIYVEDEDSIQKVKDIIKELDEYEFNGYLPKDLITTFNNYPETIYLSKFDAIEAQLIATTCWVKGIRVLIVEGRSEMVEGMAPKPDSLPGPGGGFHTEECGTMYRGCSPKCKYQLPESETPNEHD